MSYALIKILNSLTNSQFCPNRFRLEINKILNSINDKRIKNFDHALNNVLLNLAKRVAGDGEGASGDGR